MITSCLCICREVTWAVQLLLVGLESFVDLNYSSFCCCKRSIYLTRLWARRCLNTMIALGFHEMFAQNEKQTCNEKKSEGKLDLTVLCVWERDMALSEMWVEYVSKWMKCLLAITSGFPYENYHKISWFCRYTASKAMILSGLGAT